MNLMEWLQFVMTGMVAELDKPGAGKSTNKRGIDIVDGDGGSPVPESVRNKVSPEHVCAVFLRIR
jgi:hypothetical protein